jgi:N-hydroxyarylamine O-acetyltransferase
MTAAPAASPALVEGYLRRLGLPQPGPPSAENLRRLHRAHVERIPYEAIEIQLGRPTTVVARDSAARIVDRHRGGYCYHLNGAFSLLLEALGYDVVWHRGGVQNHSDAEPVGATGNHLALTVHSLPDDASPTGDWLVDAGLGDALHEPLPLIAGAYRQGPFRYALRPSAAEPGGWRFEHDPRGSFAGMDFRPQRATTADFEAKHRPALGTRARRARALARRPGRRPYGRAAAVISASLSSGATVRSGSTPSIGSTGSGAKR